MFDITVLGLGDGTEVSHNILMHIGECGVGASSSAVVEYNTISYAGHGLIDMHNSSPAIRNNDLDPNPTMLVLLLTAARQRLSLAPSKAVITASCSSPRQVPRPSRGIYCN